MNRLISLIFLSLLTFFAPQSLFSAATIQGTITPLGLPSATVQLVQGNQFRSLPVLVDPNNGFYSIKDVVPGTYQLIVNSPTNPIQQTGVIALDNTTAIVDVQLESSSQKVKLTGTILGESGPLIETSVRIFQNSILIIEITPTFVDSATRTFVIENLPRDPNLIVLVSSRGFASEFVRINTQSGGQIDLGEKFSLEARGFSISGFVQDSEGNRLQGATIEVRYGAVPGVPIESKDTDNLGNFIINGLGKGNFTILASKTGFKTKRADLEIPTMVMQNFNLDPSESIIKGRVTDLNSNPISGAAVILGNQYRTFPTQLTDPQGNYIFDNIPQGVYNIFATFNNSQMFIEGVNVVAGETKIINFKLDTRPGSIEGIVIDSNTGLPIEKASVAISNGSQPVLTGQDGRYTLSNLNAGNYGVVVDAIGYKTTFGSATVKNGQISTLNFGLNPTIPGNIVGTVTETGGDPIAGVYITVFQNNIPIKSVLSDLNGKYDIQNLATGEYQITANVNDHQIDQKSAIVESNSTTVVDFSLSLIIRGLAGQVVDDETGLPIIGANIQVMRGRTLLVNLLTDDNGIYAVPNLAPGSYIVTASANLFQTDDFAAILGPDTAIVNFRLVPHPGGISGVVKDFNTNNPIAGAIVSLFKGAAFIIVTGTDDKGNYTFSNLEPGEYSIISFAANYQRSMLGSIVVSDTVQISNLLLHPDPSTIIGTVTDEGGTAIEGAEILIYEYLSELPLTSSLTDKNGNYLIENLAPGAYILTASAINFSTSIVGGIINPNQTKSVDFVLTGDPGSIVGTVRDASTGNPIGGALISAHNEIFSMPLVETDPNGIYILPGLPSGQYDVECTAKNFQFSMRRVNVSPDAVTNANFRLQPLPGKIVGIVSNNGSLIPGAKIFVFDELTQVGFGETDAFGNYSISGLAPGIYTIRANAENFSDSYVSGQVISNQTTFINFNLIPNSGNIQGTVTSNGLPIAGARVTVYDQFVEVAFDVTDAEGKYIISGLEPNTYTISVKAINFQGQTKPVTVIFNETTTVDFSLIPNPGSISGRVVRESNNRPISNATVAVFQESTIFGFALTDRRGRYTISGLAPGNYNVLAIADGFQSSVSRNIAVMAGSTTVVNFALAANSGTLVGTILNKCTCSPIPGALISVMDGTALIGFGVADSAGNYIIENLPPGNFSVIASKNHFTTAASNASIEEDATTVLNFSLKAPILPPESICGVVKKGKKCGKGSFVHIMKWRASPSSCVRGYQIFRNCKMIAFVTSLEKLRHIDFNFKKGDVYIVKTVDCFDQVSEGVCTEAAVNP